MRAFGARGFVSPEQLKRTDAVVRAIRRALRVKERARIAALSDRDIVLIMARTIVERIRAAHRVEDEDFSRAGIPAHRLAANKDAAMREARRIEPRIDAMLGMPVAA